MWFLLLLPAAAIVAWFLRWRTLAARERWRNRNAARYARWAREDEEVASEADTDAGTQPEQLTLPP
jgi:hypothetical protein